MNGGLFEADYGWKNSPIDLPNHVFSNTCPDAAGGNSGSGILDVFDRYNFTIKEDEPLEKEVAVDPEMLGKVFENMLEVKERKRKGAFYTPREIVHYMCQESLIHYLDNHFNPACNWRGPAQRQDSLLGNLNSHSNNQITLSKAQPAISKDDLITLIRRGNLALENDQQVIKSGKETDRYLFQLPKSVRQHAQAIDDALADIKVCDPAIGSGAFAVGLLHEIVGTRQNLATHNGNQKTAYQLKRHTIQNSIYGVDKDESAIDIARLRLWLSLIVDVNKTTAILKRYPT